MITAAEQALAADRNQRVSHRPLVSSVVVARPLKWIYKASQDKKENSSPWGAEWFLFFYLTAPSSVFQKRTGLCNRIL
jgi:hypothetical protein